MIGILLNLFLNLAFVTIFHMGLASLPFTTSMVALLNFLQLYLMMRGQVGSILRPASWFALLRIVAACAAMAVVVLAIHHFFGMENRGFLLNLIILMLQITVGAATYAAAGWLLRVQEIHTVGAAIRRRLTRGRRQN